jgi:hypothetical protein
MVLVSGVGYRKAMPQGAAIADIFDTLLMSFS